MKNSVSDEKAQLSGSDNEERNYNQAYDERGMPHNFLYGKNKSIFSQLSLLPSTQKTINKNEIKPFDNFFRCLKDDRDWQDFCKLLKIYFDGVLSLSEFFKLYDEKFQSKVRQETKDEIERLLPTRDLNRRAMSNLLKPWNDTEN